VIKIFTAKDKNFIERSFNEFEDQLGSNYKIISLHWSITDNTSEDDKPPYQSLLVYFRKKRFF
jgi:hypothetical protein